MKNLIITTLIFLLSGCTVYNVEYCNCEKHKNETEGVRWDPLYYEPDPYSIDNVYIDTLIFELDTFYIERNHINLN